MFATRTVNIRQSDGETTVSTQCRYPLLAVPIFFFETAFWLAFVILCGGSAIGLISPETDNPALRVLAGLFAGILVVLGILTGPKLFRATFAQSEFRASKSGFCVWHKSLLGTSLRHYSWEQVEWFTEIVTGGEFNRDLAMISCGRHVALDYGLSAKCADQAANALTRCLEMYGDKPARR